MEVIADHSPEGSITPLVIIWEDGRHFEIDRVCDRRYAASMKVGGHGMRYTVVVGGKTRYLWHDDRAWYVERIVHNGITAL